MEALTKFKRIYELQANGRVFATPEELWGERLRLPVCPHQRSPAATLLKQSPSIEVKLTKTNALIQNRARMAQFFKRQPEKASTTDFCEAPFGVRKSETYGVYVLLHALNNINHCVLCRYPAGVLATHAAGSTKGAIRLIARSSL